MKAFILSVAMVLCFALTCLAHGGCDRGGSPYGYGGGYYGSYPGYGYGYPRPPYGAYPDYRYPHYGYGGGGIIIINPYCPHR